MSETLICGRDRCDATASHYIQFHPCTEDTLPPHLVCEPCLRDLRRTFEHGRAVRCRVCGADQATFDQFVPVVEEVGR